MSRSRVRYLGFGRETSYDPDPTPTAPRWYRMLTTSQEICEVCDEIDERDRMLFAGSDQDGAAVYVCGHHALPPPRALERAAP